MGVSLAADAAFRGDECLAVCGKIREDFIRIGILYDRSNRDGDDQIGGTRTGFEASPAVTTPPRDMPGPILQVQQGVVGKRGLDHDVTALAAVSAVGSSLGNVFFPPEADAAASPVPGFYIDFRFVDEFHIRTQNKRGTLWSASWVSCLIVTPIKPAHPRGTGLHLFNLYRRLALDVLFHFKLHLVPFFEASEAFCNDGTVMDKNIPA